MEMVPTLRTFGDFVPNNGRNLPTIVSRISERTNQPHAHEALTQATGSSCVLVWMLGASGHIRYGAARLPTLINNCVEMRNRNALQGGPSNVP